MDVLTDTPQIIEPADFGYSKKSVRAETAKTLRTLPTLELQEVNMGDYKRTLLQSGSSKKGYIWCSEDSNNVEEVTFLVKYVPTALHGGPGVRSVSTLTQVAVWNSRLSNPTTGGQSLPSKVFFEVLLPRFGAMSSDAQQTTNGRQFWEHQIVMAFHKNLFVYISDAATSSVTSVRDLQHAKSLEDTAWGTENNKFKVRWIVSNKPLHGVK